MNWAPFLITNLLVLIVLIKYADRFIQKEVRRRVGWNEKAYRTQLDGMKTQVEYLEWKLKYLYNGHRPVENVETEYDHNGTGPMEKVN